MMKFLTKVLCLLSVITSINMVSFIILNIGNAKTTGIHESEPMPGPWSWFRRALLSLYENYEWLQTLCKASCWQKRFYNWINRHIDILFHDCDSALYSMSTVTIMTYCSMTCPAMKSTNTDVLDRLSKHNAMWKRMEHVLMLQHHIQEAISAVFPSSSECHNITASMVIHQHMRCPFSHPIMFAKSVYWNIKGQIFWLLPVNVLSNACLT